MLLLDCAGCGRNDWMQIYGGGARYCTGCGLSERESVEMRISAAVGDMSLDPGVHARLAVVAIQIGGDEHGKAH